MRGHFHQNGKYASVLALFSEVNFPMLASKNLLSYCHAQANPLVIHSEHKEDRQLFVGRNPPKTEKTSLSNLKTTSTP
jgi:hypothetical protein